MKKILPIILMTSGLSFANCENSELKIQVNLTSATFDNSYTYEDITFSNGDSVEILDKTTNTLVTLKNGILSNDGAGNFSVEAQDLNISADIYLDHDHETWHTDGLSGGFTLNNKDFDISSLICEFDELFVID